MLARRNIGVAVIAVGLVGVLGTGIGVAAIPSSDGVISGCADKRSGAVTVYDAEAGGGCTSKQRAVDWYSKSGADAAFAPQGEAYTKSESDQRFVGHIRSGERLQTALTGGGQSDTLLPVGDVTPGFSCEPDGGGGYTPYVFASGQDRAYVDNGALTTFQDGADQLKRAIATGGGDAGHATLVAVDDVAQVKFEVWVRKFLYNGQPTCGFDWTVTRTTR